MTDQQIFGRNSMKTKIFTHIFLVSCLLLVPFSLAGASDLPPMGSQPLSTILKSLEEKKSGVISEADFDHGLWEVKIRDAGIWQKIYIDPISSAEKRREKTEVGEIPPANAMPISMIVQSVEARGAGIIKEVEFEHGFWEVELLNEGRKIKLTIDPKTGKTRQP